MGLGHQWTRKENLINPSFTSGGEIEPRGGSTGSTASTATAPRKRSSVACVGTSATMAPTRSGKQQGKRRGSYMRGSANVQLASEKKEEPVLNRKARVLSEAWKQLIDEVFFRENTYVTLKGELDLVDKEGAKLEMIKFLENVFGRDDAAEMDVKVLDVGKKKFLCRLSDDEMDKLSQEYDEQVEVEDPRGDFC